MDRLWKMTLVIVSVIIIDQLSKGFVQQHFNLLESLSVIDGFFNLTYVRNTGAAFGMGAGVPEWQRIGFFLIVPSLACFWIAYLIIDSLKKHLLACLAYSLILGGAIGNLIDRYTLGYVVDFFDFYVKTWHFATFNVADSAISVGATFLVIFFLFIEKKTPKLTESKP